VHYTLIGLTCAFLQTLYIGKNAIPIMVFVQMCLRCISLFGDNRSCVFRAATAVAAFLFLQKEGMEMKEMKKILSVGLIIMLLLSMTACSAAPSDQSATSSASDPTSVATESLATTLMTIPTKNPPTTANKMPTAAVTQTFSTAPVKIPTTAAPIVPGTAATNATTIVPTKCGHSNTEWVIDKTATCTSEGKKHKICTDCKTVLENAVIKKVDHSYSNYKCSVCGEFQKNGISSYLSEWVQKNGKVHGETISLDYYVDDILYGFTYNATGNYFYFSLLDESYNDFLSMKFTETAGVYELAYIQGTEPDTREVYGKIDASKFTENTPITVQEYLGNSDGRSGAVENCRICTGLLLEAIEIALNKYEVGLTLNDLGFSALK